MSGKRYFANLYQDQKLLDDHGLVGWPDGEELARYVLKLEEKVDMLAALSGVSLERDVRGRLHAVRREGLL